ncbi:hypothetical protein G5B30_14640 [Sphingobacterium sp. SGG-5]|uniref:hypothetical protein n=1 Tax=Sphingobacterium sp. SGG-5 TaxID=2710881 RepID=UPI0013EE2F09|nr:hypothetical protein [Sphingobacterium sp. SGG-5]NGM63145.1 hypothetical protein [Sphingobacterium sp. SGG-5]
MKKYIINTALLVAVIGLTVQCQQRRSNGSAASETKENIGNLSEDTALYATLESVEATPSLQDSVLIRFTVNNPTQDTLRFTTYHTPFEGSISKFLTIKDSAGNGVDYIGPMVKRVMPPPADTYHIIAPDQKESVTFDLKKSYRIEVGTYTLQYNGENISGVMNGEALTITVTE